MYTFLWNIFSCASPVAMFVQQSDVSGPSYSTPPPTLQPPFSKPTYIFIIASPLVRVPRGKRVHCGEINPLFYSTVQ